MWINHYLRDDSFIIEYTDSLIIYVDGFHIIDMINAIEKYNDKDLLFLKLKINYKAKFYNKYHSKDCFFEPVTKGFPNIEDDDELFELVDRLIEMVDCSINSHYCIAAKIVIHSELSDFIFNKSTNYYKKDIFELFNLLKDETGLKEF